MAVLPAHWGRHFGQQKLQFLIRLRAGGYRRAELHVPETNDRARRLYALCVWRLLRLGDEHPDGAQAVYAKALCGSSGA